MTDRSSGGGSKRVLHCPENLGNNAKCLSDLEKAAGIQSECIALLPDAYGFEPDRLLVKSGSFVLGELARWRLLLIAIRKFDVIHFNNGKTIMPHRIPFSSLRKRTNWLVAALYQPYSLLLEGLDLPILKFLGKEILFTFQGSDARLSSHYTGLHPAEVLTDLNPDYLSRKADEYKKHRIRLAEKYAQRIYCLNPDLLVNFSDKARFRSYYNVNLKAIVPHKIFNSEKVKIVHAPSKRDIKGTKYIVEAVQKLQASHPEIELHIVEGLTNAQAQKVYDEADIFIDQLIVGWFGGVAFELMARGVPVMCFIEPRALPYLKHPIIKTSLSKLAEDLEKLITMPRNSIQKIGEESLMSMRVAVPEQILPEQINL